MMNATKRQCTKLVEPCGTRSAQYRVKELSIGPGQQGTVETVRLMARLAREALQYQDFCDFMSDIVCTRLSSISPDDIDNYLRTIYRYENEQIETLYSPAYNVYQLQRTGYLIGDCDDISMLYASVFLALGYKARFVAMRTKPNDMEYYHVVTDCKIGEHWKRYDATMPKQSIRTSYGSLIQEV